MDFRAEELECRRLLAVHWFSTGTDIGNVAETNVLTADMNGDGSVDLVYTRDGGIDTYLNDGKGNFAAAPAYSKAPAGTFNHLAAFDFNGDDKIDLADVTSDGVIQYFQNTGSGLANAIVTPAEDQSTDYNRTVVAGIVGNQPALIITSSQNAPLQICRYINGGLAVMDHLTLGVNPLSTALADVNGDNENYLVFAVPGENEVAIWLGNAQGSFQTHTTIDVPIDPHALTTGDLNGDGLNDIVATGYSPETVAVLLNTTTNHVPSFSMTELPPYSFAKLEIADINNDGFPDIVGDTYVLLNEAASPGKFDAPQSLFLGTSGDLAVADFNGDNRSDLAYAWSVNKVFLNIGPVIGIAPTSTTLTAPQIIQQNVPFTMTAKVVSAGASGGIPTGQFQFFQGNTLLGTAPVKADGTATFNETWTQIGPVSFSASYIGNTTFASSDSAASETYSSPIAGPYFTLVTKVDPHVSIKDGNTATITITVTNDGLSPGSGGINFAITPIEGFNGKYFQSVNAPTINEPATLKVLQPGESQSFTFTESIPIILTSANGYGAMHYDLAVGVTGTGSLSNENFGDSPGADPSPLIDPATLPFSRPSLKLSSGAQLNVKLKGPGFAMLTDQGNGQFKLSLNDTAENTAVTVTVANGPANLADFEVPTNLLKSFVAPAMDTLGMVLPGKLLKVVVHDVGSGGLNRQTTNDSINITLHDLNGPLGFGGGILSLTAHNMTSPSGGYTVSAPWIVKMNVAGDFGGNLEMMGISPNGNSITSLKVGGSVQPGIWIAPEKIGKIQIGGNVVSGLEASVVGGIGSMSVRGGFSGVLGAKSINVLHIGGDLTDSNIISGVDFGSDNSFRGTSSDTYFAGHLSSLFVGGSIVHSQVVAGVDPVDDVFGDGDDVLIPGGKIGSIHVGGKIDSSSHVIAARKP